MARVARTLAATALLVVGCAPRVVTSASPPPPPDHRALDGGPTVPPDGPTSEESAPFERDRLWDDAIAGAPIDLSRLANREGATGLIAGLRRGREVRRAALLALPLAPDREVALRPLCELAAREPADVVDFLRAVHEILASPLEGREHHDAAGPELCRTVLDGLAANASLAPSGRDLAQSARRLLEEPAWAWTTRSP